MLKIDIYMWKGQLTLRVKERRQDNAFKNIQKMKKS